MSAKHIEFEAQFRAALNLHQTMRLGEARAIYERLSLKKNPRQADASYLLGTIQFQMRQFDAAVSSYAKAIAVKPGYAEAYCCRGDALQELNRFKEAVADYAKAIKLQPRYVDAYINRGVAHQQMKQVDAAVIVRITGLTVVEGGKAASPQAL